MILKYIFDRVVALIGLLFLWPVLLIVAILVKVKMPGGPAFFVQKRVGKGSWLVALLLGCSISITVEALQFWFMKGFSEVDDVMHNTVGCLLGWFMVKGVRLLVKG